MPPVLLIPSYGENAIELTLTNITVDRNYIEVEENAGKITAGRLAIKVHGKLFQPTERFTSGGSRAFLKIRCGLPLEHGVHFSQSA